MQFTPLDLRTYPRAQQYHYFANMAPTGYSLTVELDVTALRARLKAAGRKFFPTYLYLVTTALNRQTAFKMAIRDNSLGYYDTLTPLYATFHEDDHTFSLMYTPYDACYERFYAAYLRNQEQYGGQHGVLSQPGIPPENAYTVSCLPWESFTHFAVHSYENKPYYFPSVEAGRFVQRDGKCLLPFSITCHHATTDGYHVHCFLRELQQMLDTFPVA